MDIGIAVGAGASGSGPYFRVTPFHYVAYSVNYVNRYVASTGTSTGLVTGMQGRVSTSGPRWLLAYFDSSDPSTHASRGATFRDIEMFDPTVKGGQFTAPLDALPTTSTAAAQVIFGCAHFSGGREAIVRITEAHVFEV